MILLPWWLHHLTACPRHLVLLHGRCPGCAAPLRLDVGRPACGRCGQVIAAVSTRSISEDADSAELTTLLWCATGCTDGLYPPAGLRLAPDHPVRRLGTPALLRGLWACAAALLSRGTAGRAAPRLHALEIAELHDALVAAWRLLRDWPAHEGAPFPLVLDGWDKDRTGRGAWDVAGARWLGLVRDRSAEGYVWGKPDLPACPGVPCVRQAERWGGEDLWLGPEEAAAYCQVSSGDLVTLTEAGLIRPTFGPFLGGTSARWLYSERTVRRSLQELWGPLPVRALMDIDGAVGDVAWALGDNRGRVALVELVWAVRAGVIPAFRVRPTVELCDVWFERAAITSTMNAQHG